MKKFFPRLRSGVFSLTFFAALLLLLAATQAGAQPAGAGRRLKTEHFKGREVVAGQVLVKFRDAAAPEEVERAKGNADVEHERPVGGRGLRLFQSRSKNAETLVSELSARADVLYAEPNYVIRTTAVPNDPRFAEQWALKNTGYTNGAGAGTPGVDIKAPAAWDITTGSRSNVIAVIDTGVQANHPDLAANMWSAPAPFTVSIGGQSITCAAGTHGFNAVAKTCTPTDDYGHGTHVAGILGAVGNNGVGGAGVNWTASIMDIKFMDATGSGTLADALDAISFAIQAKRILGAGANVRVLNNSWGWEGPPSQALLDMIRDAGGSNMLFVAGAGNGGGDRLSDNNDLNPDNTFYPGSYDTPNVVSVAATDNSDALASFSNYGATKVHLGAPGVLIDSTVTGGGYDYWSGTSMAAPQVSGAAALVLSRCSLDTAGLRAALLANVDPAAALTGRTSTGGRLNVAKTLAACATGTQPSPTPTPSPSPTPTPAPSPSPTPSPTPAPNSPPMPNAGGLYNAQAGQVVQFYGGGSTDSDGTIVSYNWQFGDGTTASGAMPSHTYAAAGTYAVTLTVTDDDGASASATTTATISRRPGDTFGTGTAGKLVRWLDGSGALGDSNLSQSGGNIGVGIARPTQRLHVVGTYSGTSPLSVDRIGAFVNDGTPETHAVLAVIAGSNGVAGIDLGDTHNQNQSFIRYNNGALGEKLRFGIDNIERLTILSNGNVGVGAENPQSTLQVNGYVQLALTSGAPPAADCDNAAEYGRMKVDAVGVKIYVCTSAGWKSTALQ